MPDTTSSQEEQSPVLVDRRMEGHIPDHLRSQPPDSAFENPNSFVATDREERVIENAVNRIMRRIELMTANQHTRYAQQFDPAPETEEPSPQQQFRPPTRSPNLRERIREPWDNHYDDTHRAHAPYADFKDRKEPRVCSHGKFNPKKHKAEVWLRQYQLWVGTQFTNLSPEARLSRTIESFGASMGTEEAQSWFVQLLQTTPKAHAEAIYQDFRQTFMSVRDQLLSGSLVLLDKCKQTKKESVKAYNNRFSILDRQYLEATLQGQGVYDEAGVRKAYLKNLFLPDIAKRVHQGENLDWMMAQADKCALKMYELYLARHDDELDESSDDEESPENEDGIGMNNITKKTSSEDRKMTESISAPTTASKITAASAVTSKNNTVSKDSVSKDEFDVLSREMDRLKILISKGNRSIPRPAGPPTTRYSGEKSHLLDKQCYNCHQLGHFARDCPSPKTGQTMVIEALIDDGVGVENFDVRCYFFGYVEVELDF